MLGNRLCVAKTTPLLLGLRGTFDDEIPLKALLQQLILFVRIS